MHARPLITTSALVLAMLACREDPESPTEPTSTSPQANASAAAALTFRQVHTGGDHSCAVTTADEAYCWGVGSGGQLGIGTETGLELCGGLPCSVRPVAVVGGLRFRSVVTGTSHSCGVTIDDRAFCWGRNTWGQIGDGTGERTLRRLEPTAVLGGIAFRQLVAGTGHTCGRTSTDLAYCWGLNSSGQLGDGTTTNRLTAVQVAGRRRFRQLSAGSQHTCGITTAGESLCWGDNHHGQIGDSTTAALRRRPTLVAGGHEFRQIDVGTLHTCAVTTGNRAFCWGDGHVGQLGDGNTLVRYWPRAVRGKLPFKRVTAGDAFTCGETTGDRAYCWGYNEFGQLGDGTTIVRLTPVPVAGGLFFKQVDAASTSRHTCGTTSAAALYCWGWNLYGQLGNGTTNDQATPTPVAGPI